MHQVKKNLGKISTSKEKLFRKEKHALKTLIYNKFYYVTLSRIIKKNINFRSYIIKF